MIVWILSFFFLLVPIFVAIFTIPIIRKRETKIHVAGWLVVSFLMGVVGCAWLYNQYHYNYHVETTYKEVTKYNDRSSNPLYFEVPATIKSIYIVPDSNLLAKLPTLVSQTVMNGKEK